MSIFASGLVVTILVLAIAGWLGLSAGLLVILAIAMVAVTIGWGLVQTIFWKYSLTDKRLIVRHGLISVTEQTAALDRVQDMTLRQSLFDRLFKVGTLHVDTAGSSGGAFELLGLDTPASIRGLIESAVRSFKDQHQGL